MELRCGIVFLDGDKFGNPVGKVKAAVLTGFSGAADAEGCGVVDEDDREVVLTGDSGGRASVKGIAATDAPAASAT